MKGTEENWCIFSGKIVEKNWHSWKISVRALENAQICSVENFRMKNSIVIKFILTGNSIDVPFSIINSSNYIREWHIHTKPVHSHKKNSLSADINFSNVDKNSSVCIFYSSQTHNFLCLYCANIEYVNIKVGF